MINTRALHHAAGNDSVNAARFLIELGAEIDPRDGHYGGPPFGWAAHGDKQAALELLSRYTRYVWGLSFFGFVDRLRDVINSEPELARSVSDGVTLLWWLPDDENKATEIADLLLANGADPSIRSKTGKTAADWAVKRGMLEAAKRLATNDATDDRASPPRPDLEIYENLAQDLLFAFESGHAGALSRLNQHYGISITWAELRESARRRIREVPDSLRPSGYFGMAHARLLVVRQAGYESWRELCRVDEQRMPEGDISDD